jgi:hypothetical protein
MTANDQLKLAIAAALAGEWDKSHRIVQELDGPLACRIHAVLHKIEGDKNNSRYWYAHTQSSYEDFPDPEEELMAIARQLEQMQER